MLNLVDVDLLEGQFTLVTLKKEELIILACEKQLLRFLLLLVVLGVRNSRELTKEGVLNSVLQYTVVLVTRLLTVLGGSLRRDIACSDITALFV